MSIWGDSSYDSEKNDITYELEKFLETHPISELLTIVAYVVESMEILSKNE